MTSHSIGFLFLNKINVQLTGHMSKTKPTDSGTVVRNRRMCSAVGSLYHTDTCHSFPHLEININLLRNEAGWYSSQVQASV